MNLQNNENNAVPAHLDLTSVQIIHRHGPRTPLSYRLPHLYPFAIPLCSSVPRNNGFEVVFNGDESFLRTPEQRRGERWPNQALERERTCLLGELTDHGKSVMVKLGEHFHQLYRSKLGTLSDENVHLRSTNLSRTIESLGCVLRGLFPDEPALSQKLKITVRDEYFEDMYGSVQCARYRKLLDEYARIFYNTHQNEEERIKKSLPRLFSHKNLYGQSPSIYGVYDTLAFRKGHGLNTPEEVDVQVYKSMEEFSAREIFGIFYHSPEAIKFAVGRFLREIHSNLFLKDRRLSIYSGHDSTLAPLLAALTYTEATANAQKAHENQGNIEFPSFASYIAIEKYSDGNPEAQKNSFVRVLFNGRPLPLQACAAEGMHLRGRKDICALEAFAQAIQRHMSNNYLEECNL